MISKTSSPLKKRTTCWKKKKSSKVASRSPVRIATFHGVRRAANSKGHNEEVNQERLYRHQLHGNATVSMGGKVITRRTSVVGTGVHRSSSTAPNKPLQSAPLSLGSRVRSTSCFSPVRVLPMWRSAVAAVCSTARARGSANNSTAK